MNPSAMTEPASRDRNENSDPAPAFATAAEIDLARRLRDQLEQRYLGGAGKSSLSPLPAPSSERR
jgi:hypothetical protein